MTRYCGFFLCMGLAIGGFAVDARAENTRRIVVSAAAGGGLDTVVRKISPELRSALGHVIVDNKPGSSGMTAIESVRHMSADGSVLMAVFVNESPNHLAGYASALSALDEFVPIAYLGSNTGASGKAWYGMYGPPGMSAEIASELRAAVQSAIQSQAGILTAEIPGWRQDRPVTADSLAAAATQAATAARQLAPAPAPPSVVKESSQSAPAAASSNHSISADETLCDVAMDEWRDRQAGESREKYPFLAYLRVSNARIDRRVHEFDLSFFRRCAKDEAEYQDRTKWIHTGLRQIKEHTGIACGGLLGSGTSLDERFKGLFNDEYIRNYGCDQEIPVGFEDWFAKYQQDAQISLDSARARMAKARRPAVVADPRAEQLCAAKLKDISARLEAAQREIPRDSIVVLSEAALWAMSESIATIDAHCPQSDRYRAKAESLRTSHDVALKVCNGQASRPCAAQLPVKEVARPVPVAAPEQEPLDSKPPAGCDEGTGQNWTACLSRACAEQGGEFVVGDCASCRIPGRSWTRCPKGSGGVSSAQ